MDTRRLAHHEFPILGRAYFLGGRASTSVKQVLREAGVDDAAIRRIAVACYEAEMNVVLHARSGYMAVDIYPDRVTIAVIDKGPGIENVDLAMTPGWSSATDEARALGFGAGMGLPNIREQADAMDIRTAKGDGVQLFLTFKREVTDDGAPPTGDSGTRG
ncbi:MAG: anti-sigma regulatory factor [Armatimonadetes bacterium]|nr:anti-sigma regulatory factor [Armatimonadota bacterium]